MQTKSVKMSLKDKIILSKKEYEVLPFSLGECFIEISLILNLYFFEKKITNLASPLYSINSYLFFENFDSQKKSFNLIEKIKLKMKL